MTTKSANTTLGAILTRLCEARGWTLYRLSQECGINRLNVYRWVNGERRPMFEDVCRMADALGVDVGELRPDLWPEQGEK